MKKILGSRGIGKSTQLMQYANDNGINYIICSNASHHIIAAYENSFKNLKFVQYNDTDSIKYLVDHKIPFLVDDLDSLLKMFLERG